jgi:AcrR family transcriptional regulator
VRAGLQVLARDGIDAVRVEPLAARLGVTKGSFYWHFKDRADLHAAMLEAWRIVSTGEIIDRVDAAGGSGSERLGRLVELTTTNEKAARLETAIRAWARTERTVAKALAEIDGKRLDYVARLLVACGAKPDQSKTGAKLLYLAVIGSYFAGTSAELAAGPEVWRDFASTILR